MRARACFYVCSAVLLLALAAARADARQAVTLRLHPEVTTVRQGDPLRLDLTFTNTGTAPVRLWVPVLWGTGKEPLLLKIRAANGVERVFGPALSLAGSHDGSENYPVLAAGESVSVWLAIGDQGPKGGYDRRVFWWAPPGRPQRLLPYQQAEVYHDDGWRGFPGPGEYRVSVRYDLRRAEQPFLAMNEKPDSNSNMPLFRALLRAPAVRVVVMPRR